MCWSCLTSGFLGTERQVHERIGKPILLSRNSKTSSKEQEAGTWWEVRGWGQCGGMELEVETQCLYF